MIDKDFELQGEAAERPRFKKKLNWAHIPEGYSYAAVDKDGEAYAYSEKPERGNAGWCALREDITFLGKDFDSSDWANSLVSRETAERPQAKKLTAGDIPDGYNYAAVDSSGNGFTYQGKPKRLNTIWVNTDDMDHFLIGQFDPSDWANSLVSRETAERPEAVPEALKDQENKPSFLEIDPNFLEAMAWRMTSNKGKYPPNNWQRPHDLLLDVDAIYRHLNDIKRQLEGSKSLTGESIQKHCAAIACNAMFLFYHTQEDQWQRAARSRQSNASQI